MSKTSNKNRLYILAGVVVLVILAFIFRLYTLQVVHGDQFRERASSQYTEQTTATNERGTISLTARDGSKRSAALQESGYLLAINGRVIQAPSSAYEKVSTVVDIPQKEFMSAANNSDDPYIVVKEKLATETGEQINNLGLDGVTAYPQKWRRYPLDSLASHVLGFVGFTEDSPEPVGIYGVEKYHDDVLSRDPGGIYTNLFARVFSQPTDTVQPGNLQQSGDVNLTIEPDVQAYLEKQIADTKKQWEAAQTMGVVIDPDTGAIRALAANPDFNPNTYGSVDSPDVFTNPIVQSRYEMGSIIKALTMTAGLDAGAVTPETTYEDTGEITLNESTIANYDGVARGVVDMQEVLNQSLNTGAAYVAEQLGRDKMRTYFRNWFNERTGVDLPGEIDNGISNLDVERDLEFATASFGQGIALTPIATVRALSTLANGGHLVRPHVTRSIDYQLGGTSKIKTQKGEHVISEEAAETVSRMLATVVDDEMSDYARDRHSIAAKTGTAQIPKPGGGYYEDTFNHTFFGYFPAYEPEYLVFLMARQPKDVKYASQTLKKPFMRMTDFLINYYNIPPDR
jgi:cell division protein FtsI/penicillin-binding protein 2